jgi:hypothetical protein
MLCSFVACSESNVDSSNRNISETTQDLITTIEMTRTEPVITELCFLNDEEWLYGQHDALTRLSVFNERWNFVSFIGSILHERIWALEHEEKLGMTYCEVSIERSEYAWSLNREEEGILPLPRTKAIETFEEFFLIPSASSEFSETYVERFLNGNSWEYFSELEIAIMELELNLETLRYFNISRQEFERENNREIWRLSRLREHEPTRPWLISVFAPEEIDILFSGDTTEIMRTALNPWSIMVEDKVYSAQWLIDHTPEDWAAAGIMPEEVQERFEIFSVALDETEVSAFEADLEVFRQECSR